jgi:hypothetical protein
MDNQPSDLCEKMEGRTMSTLRLQELFDVCERHALASGDVVVPEPYIPHLPKSPKEWNGILVLAEAQNLSSAKVRQYRESLEALHKAGDYEALHDRLNGDLHESSGLQGVGIGPWDDGTIKLAVAVLRGVETIDQLAVSNAVLWSSKTNAAREKIARQSKTASVQFWRDLLPILQPTEVWAFGGTAREVMRRAGVPSIRLLGLPGPFVRRLRMGFIFDTDRLLSAFPEVARALDALKERGVIIHDEALAVHCACACVGARPTAFDSPRLSG